jgi:hypothetical protein
MFLNLNIFRNLLKPITNSTQILLTEIFILMRFPPSNEATPKKSHRTGLVGPPKMSPCLFNQRKLRKMSDTETLGAVPIQPKPAVGSSQKELKGRDG